MLWYKSWLETRWRFIIGLALLVCSAAGAVFTYPAVIKLMPLASRVEFGGEIGRRVAEAIELTREYRGYFWSQWIRQDFQHAWTLFAVILGSGGLLAQASGGGALFTLSLPASRSRVLGVRAATGLAELLVLAVIPFLIVPLLSPAIGESYPVGDALIHAACLFVAGAVFFSLACLLSTVFSDLWRPLLIALGIAIGLGFVDQLFRDGMPLSIFRVMSAESYFRSGVLPWPGLLATAALSATLLYAAAANLERQDF